MTCTSQKKPISSGFTLVEVLIAVAILATLSALIASSWSGNVRRYQKSKIKEEVVQLLQLKMLEVEARYGQDVPSLPIEQLQSGTFEGSRYEDYRWEWEAKNIELPDLTSIVNTDGEDQMLVAVMSQFRDYLVASIKEVKVTVIYQKGNMEPLNFDIATYFVDYDRNLTMGLPGTGGGNGLQQGLGGALGGGNQGESSGGGF
ncbi:MAG: type II secretion system GspH family protein [Bdellovibrionaceae bacterium]|nr:type II secretion system GspH family protein [Pseudobdellovibrionaceae bacterium]